MSIVYGTIPKTESVIVSYTSPADTYEVPQIAGRVEVREPRTYTHEMGIPDYSGQYIASQVDSFRPLGKDHDSWRQIRKSGAVKMTDHHVTKFERQDFLLRRPFRSLAGVHPWQGLSGPGDDGKYFETIWFNDGKRELFAQADVPCVLDQVISNDERPFYQVQMFDQDEIDQAISEVKSQVVSDTLQSYDLLTDLSEAKETLKLAQSLIKTVMRPLSAMSEFRKALNHRNLPNRRKAQLLTDKWMEYRYGIMPAIYSMQDIIKLVRESNNIYRSCRASRSIPTEYSSESFVGANEKGAYQRTTGTIKVQATSKTRFELGMMSRLIDQTSINPIQTAWELIPYSFVIDWFANVGDWLLANTSLSTPGVSSSYCYSVKKEITRETFCRFHQDKLEFDWNWGFEWSQTTDHFEKPALTSTQSARIEKLTEYHRKVFHQSDVDFYVSAPFMSWKRTIDAGSLTLSNLNKALRRLT